MYISKAQSSAGGEGQKKDKKKNIVEETEQAGYGINSTKNLKRL